MRTRFLIRAVDGRLIGTADCREDARKLARELNASSIEPDDSGPELEVVIEPLADNATAASPREPGVNSVIEYLLGLDPEELAQQHRVELQEKLGMKYPEGD